LCPRVELLKHHITPFKRVQGPIRIAPSFPFPSAITITGPTTSTIITITST
jgi:hypothetical protein